MKSTSNKVWYTADQFVDINPPVQWDDIKLDTPYRINLPTKSLTEGGMRTVNTYVYRNFLQRLPDNFSPEWVVTKKDGDGGRVGTIPKRISEWLHKEHGVKTTPEFMAKVGNIAREHTVNEDVFVFDVTRHLDWNPGDFGDDGSCWWGSEEHARFGMIRAEQFALRLFRAVDQKVEIGAVRALNSRNWRCRERNERVTFATKDFGCPCANCRTMLQNMDQLIERHGEYIRWRDVKSYHTYPQGAGYGRAWLVEDDPNLITFNAYGEYQLLQMSRILSTIMGVSYRRTKVGHDSRAVYFNGDGCVIGEDVANISHMTLTFIVETSDRYTCENCDEGVHEDRLFFFGDMTMCEYCYHDATQYCEGCEETYWNDDMYYVEDLSTSYCANCIDDVAPVCVECGERYAADNMHYVESVGDTCDECHADQSTQCEECCTDVETSEIHERDSVLMCNECYDKEKDDDKD